MFRNCVYFTSFVVLLVKYHIHSNKRTVFFMMTVMIIIIIIICYRLTNTIEHNVFSSCWVYKLIEQVTKSISESKDETNIK